MTSPLDPAPERQPPPKPPTRLGAIIEHGEIKLVYVGKMKRGNLEVYLPEGVTAESIGVEVET